MEKKSFFQKKQYIAQILFFIAEISPFIAYFTPAYFTFPQSSKNTFNTAVQYKLILQGRASAYKYIHKGSALYLFSKYAP